MAKFFAPCSARLSGVRRAMQAWQDRGGFRSPTTPRPAPARWTANWKIRRSHSLYRLKILQGTGSIFWVRPLKKSPPLTKKSRLLNRRLNGCRHFFPLSLSESFSARSCFPPSRWPKARCGGSACTSDYTSRTARASVPCITLSSYGLHAYVGFRPHTTSHPLPKSKGSAKTLIITKSHPVWMAFCIWVHVIFTSLCTLDILTYVAFFYSMLPTWVVIQSTSH